MRLDYFPVKLMKVTFTVFMIINLLTCRHSMKMFNVSRSRAVTIANPFVVIISLTLSMKTKFAAKLDKELLRRLEV